MVKPSVKPSLKLALRINDEYWLDGFMGIIVEGKQRIGKSSYVSQSLAEAFGKWEWQKDVYVFVEPDYEAIKPWICYPPEEFLDLVLKVGISEKQRGVHWDDAGFWLFILDWYDPFVKTVAKYFQLAGRQFGTVILSSPSQNLISSKVLEALPELYVCKIIKEGKDTARRRPRLAKVYQRWSYPDGRKGGVKTRWKDHFDAMLPDDFFRWYKPRSDHYMKAGLELLEKEITMLKKKLSKKETEEFMEDVHKVTGSPERLKEVGEVIKQLTPQE